jgi:hypothetical protein
MNAYRRSRPIPSMPIRFTSAASWAGESTVRLIRLLAIVGMAMGSASLITRIFLTFTPLNGTVGLFALYGETFGIAMCLALFSVLRVGAAVEVLAPWKRRRRYVGQRAVRRNTAAW